MNDFDRYSKAWARIDSQIRKLTSTPIADFVAQQQALYESFGTSATVATAIQPNFEIESALYANALPAGFKYPETPLHDLVNSYYKIHSAASAPLTGAFGIQNIPPIGVQLSSGFEPLFSALDTIRISPSYVEFPAELIPDAFEYDKKLNPPTHHRAMIKLSPEQARFLISVLLAPLMFWIASYIVSLSPAAWQEKYHQEEMENDAKLIQQNETIIQQNKASLELKQKQYEATLKGIEVLEAIYEQLGSDSETLPVSDTIPPEVDFLLPQDDSSPHYDESHTQDDHSDDLPTESQHSTTPDSPDESESPSESD